MPDERPDVVDAIPNHNQDQHASSILRLTSVPDHGGSLEPNTPTVDVDIFGEAHRLKHLRTEHTAVPYLDPFTELRMEGEDL